MRDVESVDIRTHLMGLVGRTIPTMTGRPNRVLGVSGNIVIVGTEKSPQGKPVDISEIQAAADRLYQYGEIDISVPSVGYRSAFIGAVLSTLPHAVALTNPRRIRLANRGPSR